VFGHGAALFGRSATRKRSSISTCRHVVNLTDQQWNLLQWLVANRDAVADRPFYFTESAARGAVSYERNHSASIACNEIDLRQLEQERLVYLIRNGSTLQGKLTQLGIATSEDGFTPSGEQRTKGSEGDATRKVPQRERIATGALVDMPTLSDSKRRKLAVLWESIRDDKELTDEAVCGYDLGRQWLLGLVAKPPNGMNLGRLNISDRRVAAGWLGIDPSVKAAEAWFRKIDWEYWLEWCTFTDCTEHRTYAAWLEKIKRDIMAELESIWKGRSAVTDRWLEEKCGPAVEKALSAIIERRVAQARDVAVGKLEQMASEEAFARAAAGRSPRATQATIPAWAAEPAESPDSTGNQAGRDLPEHLWLKIKAALLRIKPHGPDNKDTETSLNEAYDVFARVLSQAGKPLSESLLKEGIPAMVFQWAVDRKWWVYPPQRIRRGKREFIPDKYVSAYEPIPEDELTVRFAGYKVTEDYKSRFMRVLEPAIAHWEAEALTSASEGGSPKAPRTNATEPRGDESAHMIAPPVNLSANSPMPEANLGPRGQVDRFIEGVQIAEGRRITRRDIWRVAGYTEATQFERFQRGKRASPGSIMKFEKVLKLSPAQFLERLDGLNVPR
jgi:hypothetical protein